MSKQFVSYPVTIGEYNLIKTVSAKDETTKYEYLCDNFNIEMFKSNNQYSANIIIDGIICNFPYGISDSENLNFLVSFTKIVAHKVGEIDKGTYDYMKFLYPSF